LSKTSADTRPEFFVDRSIGKTVVQTLAARGWGVHRISDVYPNDAQEIPDPQWINFGLANNWSLLTTDKRIRYHAAERNP
jgi:hypothetical protein